MLCDNLLLSFCKEPREAMLTIVKASAVLNLLIRRVCKKLYELDGPHRKLLFEEFKCLEENFATFAFAVFVAGAEFSGVKSLMTNFRKRIPRIMEEMQECVKLIQRRLPRVSETQALIRSEPVKDRGCSASTLHCALLWRTFRRCRW